MGVSSVTKAYRQDLADVFINILEEKQLTWSKEWSAFASGGTPISALSGAKYRGCNMFRLMLESIRMGYEDTRWATFVQIKDHGWKLQSGSKAATVEYWMPYDIEKRKAITWNEYHEKTKDMSVEEITEKYALTAKYHKVFNGSCIDGIPALKKIDTNIQEIVGDDIIDNLSEAMGVPILNDGGDRAFYRPSEDKIHLPKKENFNSEYAYDSTALHELGHASGSPIRLNRNIENIFGSNDYAFEELVAEITSCFMSVYLKTEPSEFHLNNHKAYVQSWIKSLKDKPDNLIKAIKEADRAANYLEEQAGLKYELKGVQQIKSETDSSRENQVQQTKELVM